MMEREDSTSITCSTEELSEVAWFLKMNSWMYSHAAIMACEPETGRKFSFNFHFNHDYATFVGLNKTRGPLFVDFNGLSTDSVNEAIDKMVASVNDQS